MTPEHTPVWMVAGTPAFSGHPSPTFGPFDSREAAQQCADSFPGRHVYDAVLDRQSNCGPWHL